MKLEKDLVKRCDDFCVFQYYDMKGMVTVCLYLVYNVYSNAVTCLKYDKSNTKWKWYMRELMFSQQWLSSSLFYWIVSVGFTHCHHWNSICTIKLKSCFLNHPIKMNLKNVNWLTLKHIFTLPVLILWTQFVVF